VAQEKIFTFIYQLLSWHLCTSHCKQSLLSRLAGEPGTVIRLKLQGPCGVESSMHGQQVRPCPTRPLPSYATG